jgi:hypothetical protein
VTENKKDSKRNLNVDLIPRQHLIVLRDPLIFITFFSDVGCGLQRDLPTVAGPSFAGDGLLTNNEI